MATGVNTPIGNPASLGPNRTVSSVALRPRLSPGLPEKKYGFRRYDTTRGISHLVRSTAAHTVCAFGTFCQMGKLLCI
jgi:hypothetical protein